ncbi:hypothetical protein GE061_020328 [Apolygus lucorum]|uniref:Uncharacterized protein n=1 Tax=Apolygus lucorum TaxID=248454 RepID=A0A8S9WJD8_APOLU|nr:hypothetical protein GE061_020328 [Apolygus lucorum]
MRVGERPLRRILRARDESQQIAAEQLLYQVQHPAQQESRLQTIQSLDIELPERKNTVTTTYRVRTTEYTAALPHKGEWSTGLVRR